MITIKNDLELACIRQNSKMLADVLQSAEACLYPGASTLEINNFIHQGIVATGSSPSLLNYPYHCCNVGSDDPWPYEFATQIGINDEIYGMPGPRKLKSGDLIKVEAGLQREGFHSVAEYSYGISFLSESRRRLLTACRLALKAGVDSAKVQRRVSDISRAIQQTAESYGYSVIREFVGSGMGKTFREEPQIPCFLQPHYEGAVLQSGMVLNIVAIIQETSAGLKSKDNVAVVTVDGTDACSNGHVVVVSERGPEILTPGPWERDERPPIIAVVKTVSEEMIKYLTRNPRALHQLDPHVFERLVGEILASFGFTVELNVRTVSGEVDIVGFTRDVLGKTLGYVVECKRYAESRRVSVAEITRILGIKEALKESWKIDRGLVVTTSDFTRDAMKLGDRWDMDLRNYQAVVEWLRSYKRPMGGTHLPIQHT